VAVAIPASLVWLRNEPGGPEWLERLPALVEECAERWSLRLGAPCPDAHVSFVAPASTPDGSTAILKINIPHEESEHEADALRHWDGRGAVRLVADDRSRNALLVERCRPGWQLWAVADEEEGNRHAAAVLRRLWRPAPDEHSFRPLSDAAACWAEQLPLRWRQTGRPYERSLLEEAVDFLREAGPDQRDPVVLHQDFHGGNVLRADREPWLAIDPKPLVGEREFDTASLLRDRRWELRREPQPEGRLRRRLDHLHAELGLDRARMRGWAVAHALAWDPDDTMIACARWLAAA